MACLSREKDDIVMGFGDQVQLMSLPHKPALDFLDAYYERKRRSAE